MNTREKVIEVFERIAHGQLSLSPDPTGAIDLQAAQALLEPRLELLRQALRADPLTEKLIAAESVTSYVVGILSGLDLAGRPDIVSQFATLYAKEAKSAIDSLFPPLRTGTC